MANRQDNSQTRMILHDPAHQVVFNNTP